MYDLVLGREAASGLPQTSLGLVGIMAAGRGSHSNQRVARSIKLPLTKRFCGESWGHTSRTLHPLRYRLALLALSSTETGPMPKIRENVDLTCCSLNSLFRLRGNVHETPHHSGSWRMRFSHTTAAPVPAAGLLIAARAVYGRRTARLQLCGMRCQTPQP